MWDSNPYLAEPAHLNTRAKSPLWYRPRSRDHTAGRLAVSAFLSFHLTPLPFWTGVGSTPATGINPTRG